MRSAILFFVLFLSYAVGAQPKTTKWTELFDQSIQGSPRLPTSSELTRAFFPYFDIGFHGFEYLNPLFSGMTPVEIDGGKLYAVYSKFEGRLQQNPDGFDSDKARYYSFIFVKDGQYEGVVHMSGLDPVPLRVRVRLKRFVEIQSKTTFATGFLIINRTLFIHDNKLEDLIFMKPDDLRLARNFVFAHYGYIFKQPEIKQYFAAQLWYKPLYEDENEVNKLFTSADKDLIAQIQLLEKLRAYSPLAH